MATQGTEAKDFDFAAAAHIIKRPRLTRILDASEGRVILLLAPAGYGKTTLAREWVATREERIYWYSGGPAMSDVAALAVDLAEVFAGEGSELAERVRFLASRGESAHVLAKAVATGAPGTAALVVADDYHLAGEGSDADEFFSELVALTSFRLLLCSRVRPAWLDARRTVYGEALVVEQEELAFTPEEGTEVLPEGGAVLEQAHGWPAVIGLAAARGTNDLTARRLAPDELYEFVANDLFDSAPAPLQHALLILAAGGDSSREVARALLGQSLSATLRALFDRGFAVRDGQGWIEIHPLLRSFLWRQLEELDRAVTQEIIDVVLRTLRSYMRWDSCLRLFERFPAETEAAEVLRLALAELLASGRTATLLRWLDVARTHRFTDGIFSLAQAELDLRRGRNISALGLGVEAARRLEPELAAQAHLVAARAAHHLDNMTDAAKHAELAGALTSSVELRTEAYWLAMMNAYERDPSRLGPAFERFRSLDDPRPEWDFRLACAEAFMAVMGDADAHEALRAAERAVSVMPKVRDPYLRTNARNLHSYLLRSVGRYADAITATDELLREAEEYGLDFARDHALLTKASALIGLRALGRAREVLRRLDARASDTVHVVRNLAMLRAKMHVATGDLDAAFLALSDRDSTKTIGSAGEYLAFRALVAAARGEGPEVRAALSAAAEGAEYDEVVAFSNLAEAIATLRKTRDTTLAASVVSHRLERGTADALVTACRAWPELAHLAVTGGASEGLQWLFNQSRDFDLGRRAGLEMPRELRRREMLSPREREVLELLKQGRTNEEIADTLFISLSTAKVHVRHIFEKLGVHSRAEAAAADVPED